MENKVSEKPLFRWRSWHYLRSVLRFLGRRLLRRLRLRTLYSARRLRKVPPWAENVQHYKHGVDRCEVKYINLASRPDRRQEQETTFRDLAIDAQRVDASFAEQGILGCARSHVLALSDPAREGKMLMICEDDLDFLVDREKLDDLVEEFFQNPGLDVLCLGYRLGSKPIPISPNLQLTDNTQTTVCYVVKERARRVLSDIFLKSAEDLVAGLDSRKVALDIAWKQVQDGTLVFAVPRQRAAVQRPGHSDIANSFVNYGV